MKQNRASRDAEAVVKSLAVDESYQMIPPARTTTGDSKRPVILEIGPPAPCRRDVFVEKLAA